MRDTFEALRDGGPRKREGGGARWGWADPGVAAEVGDRVDIFRTQVQNYSRRRSDPVMIIM